MHFQESLLPVFLGIIWQASCWILAVFCVGERKSTSEFTGFGRRWIGICTTRSTKWTHKGFWMLYRSASPSPTSKGMSAGTREKETTSSANQRETSWPMTKKKSRKPQWQALQTSKLKDQMESVLAVSREAITWEGITEYLQVFNEAKFTIQTGTGSWRCHWSKTW